MGLLRCDDMHPFIRLERLIENLKHLAILPARQRIRHFCNHPNRCQQRAVVSIGSSQGFFMALIGLVDRGQEEERVAKNCFHAPARLGVP